MGSHIHSLPVGSGGSAPRGRIQRDFLVLIWYGCGFHRAKRVKSGILPQGLVCALLEIPEIPNSRTQGQVFPLLCCQPMHAFALPAAWDVSAGLLFPSCFVRLGFWEKKNLAVSPYVHVPCIEERKGWRLRRTGEHGMVWEGREMHRGVMQNEKKEL